MYFSSCALLIYLFLDNNIGYLSNLYSFKHRQYIHCYLELNSLPSFIGLSLNNTWVLLTLSYLRMDN